MRRWFLALVVALAVSGGMVGTTQAAASTEAPCIGENASTFAPVLRVAFGQVVVAPEAQAGLTGEIASTNAQAECS